MHMFCSVLQNYIDLYYFYFAVSDKIHINRMYIIYFPTLTACIIIEQLEQIVPELHKFKVSSLNFI